MVVMHASSFYALYLVPGQTGCSHLLGLHTPKSWEFPSPLFPPSITRTDDWFSVLLNPTSLLTYLLDGFGPYKSCLLSLCLTVCGTDVHLTSSTEYIQKIGILDACFCALLVPSLMATSLPHCSMTSQSHPQLEIHESLQSSIAASLAFILLKRHNLRTKDRFERGGWEERELWLPSYLLPLGNHHGARTILAGLVL